MPVITTRAVGRRRPLLADWSFELPPDARGGDEPLTLRALIDRIVRGQVAAFRKRQEASQFIRVLTATQIAEGAKRGKILSGGSEFKPQEGDDDQAVGAALQAFEDGLYLVLIDGEEQTSLDREIFLGEESQIVFLRLRMLAGG
jgi:hypothetical protein